MFSVQLQMYSTTNALISNALERIVHVWLYCNYLLEKYPPAQSYGDSIYNKWQNNWIYPT